MTTKKARSQVKDLKERMSFLETVIGYNENSERNGNGIITLFDDLSNDIKDSSSRLDRIDARYKELNDKLDKLNDTLNILEKYITKVDLKIDNTIQKIEYYEKRIREHSDLLSDSITSSKIMKVVKGTGIIAGFLTALGTIVGIIAFLYNKIMQQ